MTIIIISACALLFDAQALLFTKEVSPAWRKDFGSISNSGNAAIPEGWAVQGKPGTKNAIFSLACDSQEGFTFLHMEADRASASIITKAEDVDLKKTPIIRWRWRAIALPDGADGRVRSKDDQAIAIYVGTGGVFNNKSISYRWDTETPKEAEGDSAYGFGTIKIKWHTLRNKEDAARGEWFIEERNIGEDFNKAWGFHPDTIYLSVSCNSQYTGSKASADLNWIEFVSSEGKAF